MDTVVCFRRGILTPLDAILTGGVRHARDDPSQPFAARQHLISWLLVFAIAAVAGARLRADDWPEWRGKGRLGVWNETGIIEKIPAGGLPVAWRTPVDEGYAGPSVSGGRVFVTERAGSRAISELSASARSTKQPAASSEPGVADRLQRACSSSTQSARAHANRRRLIASMSSAPWAISSPSRRRPEKSSGRRTTLKDFNTSIPSWGIASAPSSTAIA